MLRVLELTVVAAGARGEKTARLTASEPGTVGITGPSWPTVASPPPPYRGTTLAEISLDPGSLRGGGGVRIAASADGRRITVYVHRGPAQQDAPRAPRAPVSPRQDGCCNAPGWGVRAHLAQDPRQPEASRYRAAARILRASVMLSVLGELGLESAVTVVIVAPTIIVPRRRDDRRPRLDAPESPGGGGGRWALTPLPTPRGAIVKELVTIRGIGGAARI